MADWKVVITGGGPAGCATALALADRGVDGILLLDAGLPNTGLVGESIPPDTRLPLETLGLWTEFQNQRHDQCPGSCSSWGDPGLGYNDFLFNPHGHGWHLDRGRFNAMLLDRVEAAGVRVARGNKFLSCEKSHVRGMRLHARTAEGRVDSFNAAFMVDATGTRASLARGMGARRVAIDNLICLYGFFTGEKAAQFPRLTMLEAVEYGWWYAARLPDNRIAAALACDPAELRAGDLGNEEEWLDRLRQTRHVAKALRGCARTGDALLVCPAPSFRLDRAAGDGWLAVGDAAAAYDPISSQGIHKALAGGIEAAGVIVEALRGETEALRTYCKTIHENVENYLANRRYFYGQEQRWPDHPFWRNRCRKTPAAETV